MNYARWRARKGLEMPAEKLTDREWWLVRETYDRTLRALIGTCEASGMPGRVIAAGLLRGQAENEHADLRAATAELLREYKPNAA